MDINSKQFWIFVDLDGTLVDTVPILKKTFLNFIKNLGGKASIKDFDELNGASLEEAVYYFKNKLKLPFLEPYLESNYRKEIFKVYEKMRPRQDAKLALRKLRAQGWRLALVTSASRKLASEFLKRNKIGNLFEFIVSGEEVSRGKPDPQIYKLAKLRSGNGYHIAVEDSENGMAAAEKAGCLVFNFHTGSKHFFGISSFTDLARRLYIIDKTPFLVGYGAQPKFYTSSKNGNIDLIISDKMRKEVDGFWIKEKLKNRHLYDGRVFVPIKEKSPYGFEGVWAPYRYMYYQLQKKGFVAEMRGAVTGIVKSKGKFLILRRSNSVAESRNLYEFAPSGSLELNSTNRRGRLNTNFQVIKELKEELGINRSAILNFKSSYLVFDIRHRLFDLFYLIILKNSACPKLGAGGEHTEIRLASFKSLEGEIYKNLAKFEPLIKLYFNLKKYNNIL